MPTVFETLFPNCADVDPSNPPDPRNAFSGIPARPAVYLLTGVNPQAAPDAAPGSAETPLLLATTADLRAALRRRLIEQPPDEKSRRVAYRQIVRRVYYRPVYSAFAANVHYAHAARALFPETADALAPWAAPTAVWFVAVERPGVSAFPRIRKTNTLTDAAAGDLQFAGPIRDKHAANRLVELLEDLFDLCRHHSILIQAPHGRACAYKEMGKCPAPCDGSIPLKEYHRQIEAAWAFVTSRSVRCAWRDNMRSRMQAAAAGLQFESAHRLKQRLARADAVDHEAFAHVTVLDRFGFLSLQRGPGKPYLEPWLIHGGRIEPLPPFHRKGISAAAEELAARIHRLAGEPLTAPLTLAQASMVAVVAHHLFSSRPSGVFLPLSAFPSDPVSCAAQITREAQALLSQGSSAMTLPEQSSDSEATEATLNA